MRVLYVFILVVFAIIGSNANNMTFGDLKHISPLVFQIDFYSKPNDYVSISDKEYSWQTTEPGAINITTIIFVDYNEKSTGKLSLKNGGPGYDHATFTFQPIPHVATNASIYIYGDTRHNKLI